MGDCGNPKPPKPLYLLVRASLKQKNGRFFVEVQRITFPLLDCSGCYVRTRQREVTGIAQPGIGLAYSDKEFHELLIAVGGFDKYLCLITHYRVFFQFNDFFDTFAGFDR